MSYLYEICEGNSPARARKLVGNLIDGERWTKTTKKMKQVNITDREMLNAYRHAVGWEKLVYEFGCQLIHLSNYHDYQTNDPVLSFSEKHKREIENYLKQYHAYDEPELSLNVLVKYLPNVMDKICDNTLSILDSFKNRVLSQLSED